MFAFQIYHQPVFENIYRSPHEQGTDGTIGKYPAAMNVTILVCKGIEKTPTSEALS